MKRLTVISSGVSVYQLSGVVRGGAWVLIGAPKICTGTIALRYRSTSLQAAVCRDRWAERSQRLGRGRPAASPSTAGTAGRFDLITNSFRYVRAYLL